MIFKLNETLKIIQENSAQKKTTQISALSEIQKQFLDTLDQKKQLKLTEFCEFSGMKPYYVRKELKSLLDRGIIQKHGFTKGMYYTKTICDEDNLPRQTGMAFR